MNFCEERTSVGKDFFSSRFKDFCYTIRGIRHSNPAIIEKLKLVYYSWYKCCKVFE